MTVLSTGTPISILPEGKTGGCFHRDTPNFHLLTDRICQKSLITDSCTWYTSQMMTANGLSQHRVRIINGTQSLCGSPEHHSLNGLPQKQSQEPCPGCPLQQPPLQPLGPCPQPCSHHQLLPLRTPAAAGVSHRAALYFPISLAENCCLSGLNQDPHSKPGLDPKVSGSP